MTNTLADVDKMAVLHWYPLRIFHSSISRLKELQNKFESEPSVVETFIPTKLIDAEEETYVPALVNYIFVRTTLEDLKEIKARKQSYPYIRYVMELRRDARLNQVSRIAYVTDRDMESFRQVVNNANEQVKLLLNSKFAFKPGQRVRITSGPFKGVEGTLKSMKKHLCVVVTLGQFAAVAITGIHKKFLQRYDD